MVSGSAPDLRDGGFFGPLRSAESSPDVLAADVAVAEPDPVGSAKATPWPGTTTRAIETAVAAMPQLSDLIFRRSSTGTTPSI
ncbi:hypothetical protein MPRF_20800 [Mycolicibacterium parafortuitum]|uniref:Uncharacterized protein n=1 Tax=Mycolicibacterium parafortuitum TaxID=39692 RepID=A0A7I7U2V0_MYCPF|nr:hypothetical protein MPRF_20800 [Mycolicibacterium parafortuitum]